ncbi:MAG TPA: hypothetical protein VG015_03570 [Candidatus Dormibacteraeota bacterium]|jgi:hypothetical protein|nr:hypothetical protein [Candidatus Dormibacteraeota bacterium]
MSRGAGGAIFYWLVLPLMTVLNLALAFLLLSKLGPSGWQGWMELGAGVFCCLVAGWLAASAWSKSYWGAAMNYQVVRWRRMTDVIFRWLEEAPVSPEAVRRLQGSLNDVITEDLSLRRVTVED